jgi:hypothetical protein
VGGGGIFGGVAEEDRALACPPGGLGGGLR